MDWRYDDREFKTSWRADCYIGVLRQFCYKKALGFNDIDAYYAGLIRNGDISHEEAMKHIQFEGENDEGLVRSILMNYYGVDYDSIKNKLNNRYY